MQHLYGAGEHPTTRHPLGRARHPNEVAGFDLTFSPVSQSPRRGAVVSPRCSASGPKRRRLRMYSCTWNVRCCSPAKEPMAPASSRPAAYLSRTLLARCRQPGGRYCDRTSGD
ncbi:hypothetical protein ACIA03_08545 [Nocardioides sp. NPDC051685]|uniref:hypothetical protein n=1 Tax=Nocardioides sp. NPDC051685 TaxID=3364334 RepID=UPI0037B73E3F